MDLNLLEYYHAVYKCKSISEASKLLHISQPNLSNAITRLEKNLGVNLLNRRKGKVEITQIGNVFEEYVERALNMAAEGISRARELSIEKYLGVTSNIRHLVSMMLSEFWPDNPDFHVQYNFCHTRQGVSMLNNGEAEVGIFSNYDLNDTVDFTPICAEEILILTSKDHKFAGRTTLKLAELKDETFFCDDISLPPTQLTGIFAPEHFTPLVKLSSTEQTAVAAFIDSGKGVGILPAMIIPGYDSKITDRYNVLRISDFKCTRTIGIAVKRGAILSPESKDFIDFARDYLTRKHRETLALIEDIFEG